MKEAVLLACLAFGFVMVTSFAQAQEVEGVYCKFDVKKWEGSIVKFLKQGSECKVKVRIKWDGVEYDQSIDVNPDALDPRKAWKAITGD